MSSEAAIAVEGAGKAYALFSRPEDRLKQILFGRNRTYYQEFWALQPMDLEIGPGETWGIIGRNGSGKSTLLQMICGNLAPTAGRITVRGKVAALLELGAGFNPEFTGRENVFVNGALAGYDRAEIDARMDTILGFAEIGEFVDQPVKTYSSGMFVRLAFSCSINVDPSILVVDEALSVGDAKFQLKCFRRLEELKKNGTTILFVSHATELVKSLCDYAVVLDSGRTIFAGEAKAATIEYHKLLFPEQHTTDGRQAEAGIEENDPSAPEMESHAKEADQRASESQFASPNDSELSLTVVPDETEAHSFGIGGASIGSLTIRGLDAPNVLVGGRELTVVATFRWDASVVRRLVEDDGYEPNITLGISFSNSQGSYLFGCNGFDYGLKLDCLARESATFQFTFKTPDLVAGTYFMTAAVALGTQNNHVQLKWYDCFVELTFEEGDRPVSGLFRIDYSMKTIENV